MKAMCLLMESSPSIIYSRTHHLFAPLRTSSRVPFVCPLCASTHHYTPLHTTPHLITFPPFPSFPPFLSRVELLHFLADGTQLISEPKQDGSGLPQGVFLNRAKVNRLYYRGLPQSVFLNCAKVRKEESHNLYSTSRPTYTLNK